MVLPHSNIEGPSADRGFVDSETVRVSKNQSLQLQVSSVQNSTKMTRPKQARWYPLFDIDITIC